MARYFTILLLLAGTNLCTYAYTRYATTLTVLTKARASTEGFLREQGYLPGPDGNGRTRSDDEYVSAMTLIVRVISAGGMLYWWNDSLPYYGLGILLTAVGILLPFVRRKAGGKQGDPDSP
jgi:hypothetical protein